MTFKKLLILTLLSTSIFANEKFFNSASISLGMMNYSVTPNESTLQNTDGSSTGGESADAAAAAVSAISIQVNWEFKSELKKSYYISGVLPMMSAEGTGVYSTTIGMNWYFGDIGTKYTYTSNGQNLTITPTSKYYWGAFVGPGYVIYNTESAKYSDIFFDLGVNLGGGWRWGKNRTIKAEAAVSRATGIKTTGIKMGVFVGISQYL
ncbi:hypothetical protein ABMA70_06440 [Halobacteriovorax sp. XZX-3]|uniref:hypothetical protein n=1 Tax=unclassified Halobacteriovorax TaxID=2639665 RepID=UPI000CD29089|nr:hypothetical protein [Halobacteriovorax sp. DA5]POB14868.1 hypothetical protein C0Z22_00410 [Halobacteriovorax sp. DA5]